MWYILCTEKILSFFGYNKRKAKIVPTTVYKEKAAPPPGAPRLRVRKNQRYNGMMDQYRFDL